MAKFLLAFVLSASVSPAFACEYFVNRDGVGYVKAPTSLLRCQMKTQVGGMDVYSCTAKDSAPKNLIIEVDSGKAIFEGEECKAGTRPNVCQLTNAC